MLIIILCIKIPILQASSPGGLLGYKRDGGRGGGSDVFFGFKILTSYIFGGSEKSVHIFLGLNFRQANSSYAIQANRVFFLGLKCPVVYFFGCKILGSIRPPPPPPPSHLYLSNPPGASRLLQPQR